MIRVWRLCRYRYIKDVLSGEGARIYGGRWNSAGTRMVYCSESLSLACLEALVHLDVEDLPSDYYSVAIGIPNGLAKRVFDATSLPPDWNQIPGPNSLKFVGTQWVQSGDEAVLVVPSAVIPSENNYLINPDHSDVQKLVVYAAEPFYFDARLRE